MPHIKATQEQLALRYGLTQQTALMLAMLVCLPSVSPKAVTDRMGQVDIRVIVHRLRARLRAYDDTVVIHNRRTYGYHLDQATQERLTHAHKDQEPEPRV